MSSDPDANAAAVQLPRAVNRRRWTAALAALVIFAAGMASGAGLAVLVIVNRVHDAIQHPEQPSEHLIARLQRRLDLNDEQAAKVKAIILARHGNLMAIRRRIWPEVLDQLELVRQEVAAVLTDEQRQEWERMYAEFHKQWLEPVGEHEP